MGLTSSAYYRGLQELKELGYIDDGVFNPGAGIEKNTVPKNGKGEQENFPKNGKGKQEEIPKNGNGTVPKNGKGYIFDF